MAGLARGNDETKLLQFRLGRRGPEARVQAQVSLVSPIVLAGYGVSLVSPLPLTRSAW